MQNYNFHNLFSLSTNLDYFEGLLHSFKDKEEGKLRLSFLLDSNLTVSTKGKPNVNLMLYHNPEDDSIEFSYPWIRPVTAKLTFDDDSLTFKFSFNKNYLRFSKIVAEGWELIDIFRSLLQLSLIERDMYMIHGAAVRLGDEGILIPSFGNTGKTTTTWMLAQRGADFVTDEFAILDSDVTCFGFPCSSLVSSGLVKAAGLRLTKKQQLSLKLRDIRTKLVSTRFAPGGVKLYPDDKLKICDKVAITRMCFIQNGLDDLRNICANDAYTMLRAIQDYELNWRSNPYIIARSFFQHTFDTSAISAREENRARKLISQMRGIYLVSSSEGRHYRSIETIPKIFT